MIKIKKELYEFIQKDTKNWYINKTAGWWSDRPNVYIVGGRKRKDNIILSKLIKINGYDGCGGMPDFSIEDLSMGIVELAKLNLSSFGIVRVGGICRRSEISRGYGMVKLCNMYPDFFIINSGRHASQDDKSGINRKNENFVIDKAIDGYISNNIILKYEVIK